MNPEPVVSVLMPVHNGDKYLAEAVESILNQSFLYFELIAIDDGSKDSTRNILERYAQQDDRVKVYTQDYCGLVATLNRGLNLVSGKYLARMDADDISLPERLKQQTTLMDSKKDLVIVGSSCNLISADGALIKISRPPVHDTLIRWQLLFDNPFIHSAVMVRLETIRQNSLEYRQEAVLAEDYDLWSRLLDFGRGENIDIPLLTRRLHDQQITGKEEAKSMSENTATMIAQFNLEKMRICLTEEEVDKLRVWSHHFPRVLNPADETLCLALLEILDAFCHYPNLNQKQINLVRGQIALRLLLTKPSKSRWSSWKTQVIRRLQPSDILNMVKYIGYRQKLIG